jgi:glycosyltransferase involved in cell wall biosynthesis
VIATARMKVIVAHTRYLQPGGEDVAFIAETELLRRGGHSVVSFDVSNQELSEHTTIGAARLAVWNGAMRTRLKQLIARERPDVLHFHNTFPLISPAGYYTPPAGVAVVQTLHNYRLICPAAILLRDGVVCESCVGRFPWEGIVHACYRSSRGATAVVAAMVQSHHVAGTWSRRVHAYIALTEHARQLFIRGGLPAERVHVKPNFIEPDPGAGAHDQPHYIFVGRLDEQKGIRVLLDAWHRLAPSIGLRIIGTGPLEQEVRDFCAKHPRVEYLAEQPRDRVLRELQQARALIFPSLSHENCPFTILEAYATGLPVLCSRTANLATVVEEGVTGWLFEPGSGADLAALVMRAEAQADQLAVLGAGARERWIRDYTAGVNQTRLEAVYDAALAQARAA